MKKLKMIQFVPFIILLIYFSSFVIFNIYVKDYELLDILSNFMFFIILTFVLVFFGYLIIQRKQYTRKQRILLVLFLLIIGFIDLILLFIAHFSDLWIYYPILGICNSIGFFILIIIWIFIELKSSKN